ncbi:hypothetical protein J8J40_31150, partial [Mycobacterium tuberculosis]|nr:hypothetical protein [Mycobacterium tuberculosis]
AYAAPAPRAAFARRSDRPAILFALHWLEHGGAEAFAFATIAAAAAAGWRVVVAADRPGRHPLAARLVGMAEAVYLLADHGLGVPP